ncbi:MAG: universal stress protein [Chloroflexota bacterium]
MLNHILIPIDGTPSAEYALPHAGAIATALHAHVTLLRIMEGSSSTRTTQAEFVDPWNWQISKTEAEIQLDKAVQHLQALGIPAEKAILDSPSVSRIVEFAHEHNVNLIIMAKPGDNFRDLIHELLLRTHLPTLRIRAGDETMENWKLAHYGKLLIPLDGSQRAEHVLPLGTMLAQGFNAELHLVHVVRKPEMPRRAPLSQEDIELTDRLIDRNRVEAARYLEQLETRLSTGITVKSHLLVDDSVATALHKLIEREGIDLTILSAHGYSGEPLWPYGSIANNLIAYSPKPILVVQDLPSTLPVPRDTETAQRESRERQ